MAWVAIHEPAACWHLGYLPTKALLPIYKHNTSTAVKSTCLTALCGELIPLSCKCKYALSRASFLITNSKVVKKFPNYIWATGRWALIGRLLSVTWNSQSIASAITLICASILNSVKWYNFTQPQAWRLELHSAYKHWHLHTPPKCLSILHGYKTNSYCTFIQSLQAALKTLAALSLVFTGSSSFDVQLCSCSCLIFDGAMLWNT